ncbi:MAG: hypothetical protein R3C53_17580 [Pirellulaceae bacterium]
MIPSPSERINGYLDDVLTADQQAELSAWIKAKPEHARIFAEAILLHDRLRNTLGTDGVPNAIHLSTTIESPRGWLANLWSMSSFVRASAAAAVLVFGLMALWFTIVTPTASAAIRELDRIIVNSMRTNDRTFEIVVEEITTERRGKRSPRPETQRPPKPPLDEATLYVRAGNQFVLMAKLQDGLPFVTGSNGQQSWAVNPRGPVKVSDDVNEFNRDLPGHESSVPLTNLHDGLEQLKVAYDLTFAALGPEEYQAEDGHVTQLIAVKKPKERGPQRVEIVYDGATGGILRMRFIQMPYGPDRLDLRLSLVSEEELPSDFFQHTSHHTPDRKVEVEN